MATTRFWVGASTTGSLGTAARGIRLLEVDERGRTRLGEPVEVGPNPMYLAWARESGLLAIVHEQADGLVSTWSLGDGVPRAFGIPGSTGAADPCHLVVSTDGNWIFAANYTGGALTVHRMTDDGASDAVVDLRYPGHGPNPARQERAHAHQVVLDPARGRLLVVDLGTDAIHVHGLEGLPEGVVHTGAVSLHPGAGPRHLVVAGDTAIVANELDRTVSVVDLAIGVELGSTPVGDEPDDSGLGLSAIRLTRRGVVLVGDRASDSLCALRFDAGRRAVTLETALPTGGRHPRDLELTHDERFALVADQGSDSIAVIRLDEETGLPVGVVDVVGTEAPTCLMRMP